MRIDGCDFEITKNGDYVIIVLTRGEERWEIEMNIIPTGTYGFELDSSVQKWESCEWVDGVEDL